MASDYNYEVTPVVGYNFSENATGLENSTLYGAEFQYNAVDSVIKPELSLLYSNTDYTNSTLDTGIYRMALNGVYEYDKVGIFTPLAKMGVGYENIDFVNTQRDSHDGAFLDAGVGAKIDLVNDIALKLEAVYMLKDGVDSAMDNNLALLAGINIPFGKKPQPEPVKPVDGDDDNDGVLNSIDACPNTPAGTKVDATGCKVDGDDDNDGVLNSVDACPTTPAGDKVDATGCTIVLQKIVEPELPVCPPKMNLNINFKFDSAVIKEESYPRVKEFSSILKCTPTYKAEIIGHTDSMGSEAYNMKLSQKRADAVKAMIVENGIEADRISTVAKGESEPVATNKTREGRAQNRRIEAALFE